MPTKKKNSFAGIVGSKAREKATNPDLTVDTKALGIKPETVIKTAENSEIVKRSRGGVKPIQKDRIGKHPITTFVDKSVKKQFSMLCIENEKTQAELTLEAINDLFKKYGKPPIA